VTFELKLDIAAPAAKVFDFVADFATMPQWYSAVHRVHRLSGTGELGTRYEVFRDLPGGRARNEVEITGYRKGEDVTFTSLSGPTPFAYRYNVRPYAEATRLTLHGSINAEGLHGPISLLGPLAEQFFKRGMQDNLRVLAELVEQSGR
jgi:uncharacterized membrane protein